LLLLLLLCRSSVKILQALHTGEYTYAGGVWSTCRSTLLKSRLKVNYIVCRIHSPINSRLKVNTILRLKLNYINTVKKCAKSKQLRHKLYKNGDIMYSLCIVYEYKVASLVTVTNYSCSYNKAAKPCKSIRISVRKLPCTLFQGWWYILCLNAHTPLTWNSSAFNTTCRDQFYWILFKNERLLFKALIFNPKLTGFTICLTK